MQIVNAGRWTTAMLVGLALLGPRLAAAQSTNIDDYVLLARDSIRATRLTLTGGGNVGVTAGVLSSRNGIVAGSSDLAADVVRLDPNTVCGSLHANSAAAVSAGCHGPQPFVRPFSDNAAACGRPALFPSCDPGKPVIVPHGVVTTLPPGAYGDVKVEGGAGGSGQLVLNGAYTFCSLQVSRSGSVAVAGPTTLHVAGIVNLSNAATLGPKGGSAVLPGQITVHTTGPRFRLSRNAGVRALVCAPDARVSLSSGASFEGRLVGQSIRLKRNSLKLGTPTSTTTTTQVSGSTTTTTTSTPGSTTTTTTLPSSCGNAFVEPGEDCDDSEPCHWDSTGGSFVDGDDSSEGAFIRCDACEYVACVPDTTTTLFSTTSTTSTTTTTVAGSTTTTTLGGPTCGDGVIGGDEQCDGDQPCTSSTSGSFVSCSETCTIVETGPCDGCQDLCGNGVIDPACDEACDGTELGGAVCPVAGTPTCSADCRSIDDSSCDAQVNAEICGNCVDDDKDGLTDFEDPTCCADAQLFNGDVRRGKIKPRGEGQSFLKLKAKLAASGLAPDPSTQDVVIQIREPEGREVLCAIVPAGKFVKGKRSWRFRDRNHRVATGSSLDDVRIKIRKNGEVRFRAAGKKVQLTTPTAGSLEFRVGFRSAQAGDDANQCSAAVQAFRSTRRGAIRFP